MGKGSNPTPCASVPDAVFKRPPAPALLPITEARIDIGKS